MKLQIPDRLSIEKSSPHFNMLVPMNIDVYFNGVKQMNCVVEYCISEGWIRRKKKTALGITLVDRFKQPIIYMLQGNVRVEWREGYEPPEVSEAANVGN